MWAVLTWYSFEQMQLWQIQFRAPDLEYRQDMNVCSSISRSWNIKSSPSFLGCMSDAGSVQSGLKKRCKTPGLSAKHPALWYGGHSMSVPVRSHRTVRDSAPSKIHPQKHLLFLQTQTSFYILIGIIFKSSIINCRFGTQSARGSSFTEMANYFPAKLPTLEMTTTYEANINDQQLKPFPCADVIYLTLWNLVQTELK